MKNWKTKKLSEVCAKITDGTHQTPKYFNEGVIFLSSKNVTSGRIDWDNIKHIDEKQHLEMHKRVAPKINDILLAKNGTTGVAAMVDRNVVFDIYVSLALLRPLEGLLPNYLLHFINSPLAKNQFNKRLKGIGVPNLHLEEIREVEIPFPPLPEQQRIVAILDEVFTAIAKAKANAEQNLKNAKELFESYLQGVFENKGEGWEEKTLGEVCEYDKTSNKRDDFTYVGLEDIQSNTGIFIGPFEPRSMKSLTFYFNDEHVLYGRLRPYLNKVLLPDFEGHCSTEIFPIKPKKNVLDRGFLFQWLISTETMKKINATWTGATLPRANMNTVLEFKINLPSLMEQQTIVQKLDALSTETKKLEAIYQQKLNDLEELKKSVLQKAFSGELKVSELEFVRLKDDRIIEKEKGGD